MCECFWPELCYCVTPSLGFFRYALCWISTKLLNKSVCICWHNASPVSTCPRAQICIWSLSGLVQTPPDAHGTIPFIWTHASCCVTQCEAKQRQWTSPQLKNVKQLKVNPEFCHLNATYSRVLEESLTLTLFAASLRTLSQPFLRLQWN